jgi:hypothetical protein
MRNMTMSEGSLQNSSNFYSVENTLDSKIFRIALSAFFSNSL